MQELINGRYRMLHPIGSGGMGRVYLAHDEVLGRDVAFKVLAAHLAEDAAAVERFRREAKSAASLAHPNIVFVHDFGTSEDGHHFITMEYLPGGNLKERMDRGPIAPEEAARVAECVARALEAAHRRGIVHRDIKPQNVLLGDDEGIKVADFGIAKAATSMTMTDSNVIMGSPYHISPEQAKGEPVTQKSDLYALGVVLYEMLAGTVPHDADTPIGVVMKHINAPVRPPGDVRSGVPDELEAVTMRLLARDPQYRPESATAVRTSLADYRRSNGSGPPSKETPPTPPPNRTAPTAVYGPSRHRAAQPPANTPPPTPTARPRPSGANAQRRTRRWLIVGLAVIVALLLFVSVTALAFPNGLPVASLMNNRSTDASGQTNTADPSDDTGNGDAGDGNGGGGISDSGDGGTGTSGDGSGIAQDSGGLGDLSDTVATPTDDLATERAFFQDYYAAVDAKDWSATYAMLSDASQSQFTEDVWVEVQEMRDIESPLPPITSVDITNAYGDALGFTCDVILTHDDGSEQTIAGVQAVDEGGQMKRQLTDEESTFLRDLYLSKESQPPIYAVEASIRDHYEAIGANDFEEAYSYFGPTFTSSTPEDVWIEAEESSEIESATVESVVVYGIDGDTARAGVDVSFEDYSGTSEFSLEWDLVYDDYDGEWKLDEVTEAD